MQTLRLFERNEISSRPPLIVLRALPDTKPASRPRIFKHPRLPGLAEKEQQPQHPVLTAIFLLALEDMGNVVRHVELMLAGDLCRKAGFTDWLGDLTNELDNVRDDVLALRADRELRCDDISVSGLESLLSSTPDLAFPEQDLTSEHELLERLVQYWADSVEKRGWALVSLLMQSTDPIAAGHSLRALRVPGYLE